MDFEKFIAKVPPLAMRARMEPLGAQILQLEAMDYAQFQIRSWLDSVGVHVSPETLKEFIDLKKGQQSVMTENKRSNESNNYIFAVIFYPPEMFPN